MQVFNKIKIVLLILLLCACESISLMHDQMFGMGTSYDTTGTQHSVFASGQFKAAMLLPLTGKAAAYGQGLQNAAMMAVEDANNPNLVIEFYDTGSTAAGARAAVNKALAANAQVILGPLMQEEVEAVSYAAQSRGVPVISFSTSPRVLREGVYTLGLLGREQIARMMAYAAAQNRRRIAVLVPDTEVGLNQARAAVQTAAENGAEVVKIGFYQPDNMDFSEIVKQLISYDARAAEVNRQKAELEALAKAGDTAAAKKLKLLQNTYTGGSLDFDAILIPESGNRLKSAAAMFGYYDIGYPEVLFMGTSVWENTALNRETTLYNGVYPVLSRVHEDYFNKKYEALFGQAPNQLYSFAYDGVALASVLSRQNPSMLYQNIINANGYIGINGAFRILPDGRNQHSLDVVKVTENGPVKVNAAPERFQQPATAAAYGYYNYSQPQIFGKDTASVYNQIFR